MERKALPIKYGRATNSLFINLIAKILLLGLIRKRFGQGFAVQTDHPEKEDAEKYDFFHGN